MTIIKQCPDADYLEYPQYNSVWHACSSGWTDYTPTASTLLGATCASGDITQATNGTIRCSSGWVISPDSNTNNEQALNIEVMQQTTSALLVIFIVGLGIGLFMSMIRKIAHK